MVLHALSLTVPRRGVVALLGANGAGKTTTLTEQYTLLRQGRSLQTLDHGGERIEKPSPTTEAGLHTERGVGG
ncbi:ATP-binding cassette domain-containing protein [Paracoccus mutanolyticus]|uniref:ATP-binding cassette domain-containing protein n=1 Tax=Paracoccus mutanolyticus TaxID=1499308 RepID=UPI0037C90397